MVAVTALFSRSDESKVIIRELEVMLNFP